MRACESCISAGICAGDKSNVAVALTPLDVELFADCAVNLRLGCASVQHPVDESAPMVYLRQRSLAVKITLTGADESAFGQFHYRIVWICVVLLATVTIRPYI